MCIHIYTHTYTDKHQSVSDTTHMNESCHTYEHTGCRGGGGGSYAWIVSHKWMSHVSFHTYE